MAAPGGYRDIKAIASTAHSSVRSAVRESDGMPVCIKTVRKGSPLAGPAMKGAELQGRLCHPNICRIYESRLDGNGDLVIVQEYIDGKDLEALASERLFGAEEAARIGEALCGALSYMHSLSPPVVFRDMKPANVMLRASGEPVIVDFGIAREWRHDAAGDTANLGTRGYAAPEQQASRQSDARADIFSLGMTLHRIVTGKRPDEPPYTMKDIVHYAPAFSPCVSAAVGKATRLEPGDRWQTAREFAGALASCPEGDKACRKAARLRKAARAILAVLIAAAIARIICNAL